MESSLNPPHHHQQPAQQQQQQHQQSSSSSSSAKKFSKTPGRERKPNQGKKGGGKGTSAASGGTQQQYKGTALQFNTPASQQHKSTTLGTILQNASVPVASTATVWGENCASFSDVVAQTSATKQLAGGGGGTQSTISSIMPGMEAFMLFGGSNAQPNSKSSANLQRSPGGSSSNSTVFGLPTTTTSSTGGGGSTTAAAPSTQHYRKPLHSLQQDVSSVSTKTTVANHTEQRSKDDSYLGGTLEKECSAPFVATSGSPDLGPIGTSKKSPSGSNSADGDGEEADGLLMAQMMGGRGGSNLAKCWEPFGGHVIHNPVQLSSGGSSNDPSAATTTIGKSMNGGGAQHQHQSDSFFSQSFADIHQRQSDPYRGIGSSLLSNAGHPFGADHHSTIGGLSNGSNHHPGGVSSAENDFMEMHYRSRHQQQQQQQHLSQQQQHNQHDWNSAIDAHLQWPLSTHKQMTSQGGGMSQPWTTAELWNNLNAQHQYQQHQQQQQQHHHQQQQQQQLAAYESVLHFQSQLAMAAAEARQLQQQTVPDVILGHRAASSLSDGWLGSGMSSGQTTVAPPPGFSNHLPSAVGGNGGGGGLPSNRMVYEEDQQTFNLLLQQHRLQQQQQHQQLQQSQQQQQLIRQLSADDAIGKGGGASSVAIASSTDATSRRMQRKIGN